MWKVERWFGMKVCDPKVKDGGIGERWSVESSDQERESEMGILRFAVIQAAEANGRPKR